MADTVKRIQTAATEVRLIRVLLSILAAPFYVVGTVVAVAFLAVTWCIAAAQVGFGDVRRRGGE